MNLKEALRTRIRVLEADLQEHMNRFTRQAGEVLDLKEHYQVRRCDLKSLSVTREITREENECALNEKIGSLLKQEKMTSELAPGVRAIGLKCVDIRHELGLLKEQLDFVVELTGE